MTEKENLKLGCPECGKVMEQNQEHFVCPSCGHQGEQGTMNLNDLKTETKVEQMTLFDFLDAPGSMLAPEPSISSVRGNHMGVEVAPRDFEGIMVGSVCEIIAEDLRKERLPHLFTETEIGKRVIVAQLSVDRVNRWVWAYDAKPKRYRISRGGKKVCDYDPACMVTPYPVERLMLLDRGTATLTLKLIAD